jgi:hypothetical protein
MTFISILIFFIKGSFFLILNIIPGYITRGFIGLGLISLYCYIFRKRNITQVIHINDYKIIYPVITCITVLFTVICIISTLFTFKLLNIGNSIDLKIGVRYIINLFKTESYTVLIGNSMLILGLIFLAFLLLHYLRAFVYKQFTMIHIYLSQFDIWWCQRNNYNPDYSYFEIYNFCMLYSNRLSYTLKCFLFGSERTSYYTLEERKTHYKYLLLLETHLSLIIIILCILYDCVYNNFVLTKIYYIFPLTYIYTLWRLLVNFYLNKKPWIDKKLFFVYYHEYKTTIEHKGQIVLVYSQEVTISLQEINQIRQYIVDECCTTKDIRNIIKVIDEFNEFVNKNK